MADRVVVTWAETLPVRSFEHSVMANRLLGIAAVLGAAEVRSLAVASRHAQEVGWPAETEVLGVVHVFHGEDAQSFRVGVTSDRLALFAAVGGSEVFALPTEVCGPIVQPLVRYSGDFSPEPGRPVGEVFALPGPYRQSPILLDTATIRDRLTGGRKPHLAETDRFLPDEQFFVRLPEGYAPREPAGLVVWINAETSGRPPAVFFEAADAMGLVLIGIDNAGNARPAIDRYQLALDAVATAVQRFHIDPARVYVTGLSGGGRISSGLVACFPDVFAGGVPIVGLNTYKPVPLGDGRFVAAGYSKPKGARWRQFRGHRLAAMTGLLDFNCREMGSAVRILQRDGVDARLFEYEDMAHTLPTAERFAEAVGWVDAPYAEARADGWADAQRLLESSLAKFDGLSAENATQRRLLERMTVIGPWSPAAWRACELLGVVEPLSEQSGAAPSGAGVLPVSEP